MPSQFSLIFSLVISLQNIKLTYRGGQFSFPGIFLPFGSLHCREVSCGYCLFVCFFCTSCGCSSCFLLFLIAFVILIGVNIVCSHYLNKNDSWTLVTRFFFFRSFFLSSFVQFHKSISIILKLISLSSSSSFYSSSSSRISLLQITIFFLLFFPFFPLTLYPFPPYFLLLPLRPPPLLLAAFIFFFLSHLLPLLNLILLSPSPFLRHKFL